MYIVTARRFDGQTFATSADSLEAARTLAAAAMMAQDTASVEIKPI